MDDEVKPYLSYLPQRCAEDVLVAGRWSGRICEIRLRRELPMSFTMSDGRNLTGITVSGEEMDETVQRLCGGSLHAHEDTILQGYIVLPNGCRAGICGQASTEGGRIRGVRDIRSVNLRIPRTVSGISRELCEKMKEMRYAAGILVYSPPGEGKTTLLRDGAAMLSRFPYGKRVAVVDTRRELWREDAFQGALADFLSGYPKAEGIRQATLTLSPQILVCDEIGSAAEAEAILEAAGAGVPLLASAHAPDAETLCHRPGLRELISAGIFGCLCGIINTDGNRRLVFTRLAGQEKENAENSRDSLDLCEHTAVRL